MDEYKYLEKDDKGNVLDEQDFCDVLNDFVYEYLDKNYFKIKIDNDRSFDSPCGESEHDNGRDSPGKDNTYIIWELNIKAPEDSSDYLKELETTLCDRCKNCSDLNIYDAFHEEIFKRVMQKLGIQI